MQGAVSRALFGAALTAAALVLVGCGGGGGGGAPTPAPVPAPATPAPPPPSPPPPAPPPAGNQPPLAAFSAPDTVVAGQPIVVDASASSDADGDALVYAWRFGDGGSGGGVRVAHTFTAAGNYTIQLTVADGRGGAHSTSRAIAVAAPPPPLRTVAVRGVVRDDAGTPLSGVSATVVTGTAASATSDVQGQLALDLDVGADVTLKLAKPGFADRLVTVRLPDEVDSDGWFEARMSPREPSVSLPDASAGGAVTGRHGATVVLPPAALVNGAGNAVSGPVSISVTPIDVTGPQVASFPGAFAGIEPDGTRVPLVSYGTTEFVLTQGGERLQLAPGTQATIEMPLYATQHLDGTAVQPGDRIPLWSLDERSGIWIQEGEIIVVASATSPTGLAARATVGHFSWWNIDIRYAALDLLPQCVNDVPGQYDNVFAQAQVCTVFAEIDRTQAAPAQRSLPATRASAVIPVVGGASLPLPSDVDVILTGYALNGTWSGTARVRGAAGDTASVQIPLRPVSLGGQGETIVLPFDQQRSAQPATTDRYLFEAPPGVVVEVQLERAGSALDATLRLLGPDAGLRGSATLNDAQAAIVAESTGAGGVHAIEVVPTANAPGGYRLRVALRTLGSAMQKYRTIAALAIDSAPQVAADPSGNAIAIFTGGNAPQDDYGIYASRYTVATDTWSAPQQLSAPLNGGGSETIFGTERRIAFGANGHAAVLWLESGATTAHRIRVARFDPVANAWSPAETLGEGTFGMLSVAVDAAGNTFAAWKKFAAPGQREEVHVRRHAGGAWSATQVLNNVVTGIVGASLAADAAGNALAVWSQAGAAGATTSGIVARRFDAVANAWSAEESVVPGVVTTVKVALDGAGNAIALYGGAGGVPTLGASRRAASGGWGAPASLGIGSNASLAVAANGTALVTSLGGGNVNQANWYSPASGTWTAIEPVSAPYPAGNLAPLVDERGNAVVVWLATFSPAPPAGSGYYASKRLGGAWSSPDRLEEPDRLGGVLNIVVGGDGTAIAIRNKLGEIQAARFLLIP